MSTTPLKVVIPIAAVKSSSIAGHGYDAATKTLAVKFSGGATYHYDNVPPELVESLGKAESVGSFISRNVVKAYKAKRQDEKS